jgi:hypothetical protein
LDSLHDERNELLIRSNSLIQERDEWLDIMRVPDLGVQSTAANLEDSQFFVDVMLHKSILVEPVHASESEGEDDAGQPMYAELDAPAGMGTEESLHADEYVDDMGFIDEHGRKELIDVLASAQPETERQVRV